MGSQDLLSAYNPTMWPKAIAQLIELLPHVSRLLPMADRYFNAKTADAEASRSAMQQMAEGLRGDLGQVTASHAGLYRQLNDQSAQLTEIAADITTLRHTSNALESRLAAAERQNRLLLGLAFGILALLVGVFSIALYFLIRHA
jgi:septal ring factor EnvC (AmiA/AmiB activator)